MGFAGVAIGEFDADSGRLYLDGSRLHHMAAASGPMSGPACCWAGCAPVRPSSTPTRRGRPELRPGGWRRPGTRRRAQCAARRGAGCPGPGRPGVAGGSRGRLRHRRVHRIAGHACAACAPAELDEIISRMPWARFAPYATPDAAIEDGAAARRPAPTRHQSGPKGNETAESPPQAWPHHHQRSRSHTDRDQLLKHSLKHHSRSALKPSRPLRFAAAMGGGLSAGQAHERGNRQAICHLLTGLSECFSL